MADRTFRFTTVRYLALTSLPSFIAVLLRVKVKQQKYIFLYH